MNNSKNKNTNNNKPANRSFPNPTDTLWGKILIWVLIFMMGALPCIALIFALFN